MKNYICSKCEQEITGITVHMRDGTFQCEPCDGKFITNPKDYDTISKLLRSKDLRPPKIQFKSL